MGLTYGTLTPPPNSNKDIVFQKLGIPVATATTDTSGNYSITLSAGTYTAWVDNTQVNPKPSFNIPTGTRLVNLTH